jgi:hypothetical protein
MTPEEFNMQINSIIDWEKFWRPPPGMNTNQPLDYSTDAAAFAIPMFEALHKLAGNPEADLRQEEPGASPLVSEGRSLAECIRQFGILCYTLHNLQEQATPNFDSDYNPHQTVVAGSELLRELACLAGSVWLWGMPMIPVTSSVAGVADVVPVHVDLERAGSLHEGCVRGVHSH